MKIRYQITEMHKIVTTVADHFIANGALVYYRMFDGTLTRSLKHSYMHRNPTIVGVDTVKNDRKVETGRDAD